MTRQCDFCGTSILTFCLSLRTTCAHRYQIQGLDVSIPDTSLYIGLPHEANGHIACFPTTPECEQALLQSAERMFVPVE